MESRTCEHGLEYLAEISKQNMESVAWFLLIVYCTMQEDRGKLRNNPWRKKEPEPDLENPQPINIVKNVKYSTGENSKTVVEQLSGEEIRYATHGSNGMSQQKTGIETRISRKNLRKIILMMWILLVYVETDNAFEILFLPTEAQWNQRDKNRKEWRKNDSEHGPEAMTRGRHSLPQRAKHPSTEHYSQALKPNGTCPAKLWSCFGTVSTLFLHLLPCRMRRSVVCLSHHWILEADNFSSVLHVHN